MPPRKKKGLRRIDAAIDALVPLGFSRAIIRKTVDNLLEVYGGDVGWPFIEEASYKTVIETILEEQQNEEEQEDEGMGDEAGTMDGVEEGESSIRPAETVEMPQSDITTDHESAHNPLGQCGHALNFRELERQSTTNSDSGLSLIQQPIEIPSRRRPPCYGWISESDDDDDESSLDHACIKQVHDMVGSPGGMCRVRKRPCGWDVKPPGM